MAPRRLTARLKERELSAPNASAHATQTHCGALHLYLAACGSPLPGTVPRHPESVPIDSPEGFEAPASFDARDEWPECADLIGRIRQQGPCGGWAFGAAMSLEYRTRIKSGGEVKDLFSVEDLVSCMKPLSGIVGSCAGGDPQNAWVYMRKYGIVTGGDYGSDPKATCLPYQVPPSSAATPACKGKVCGAEFTAATNKTWDDDLHYSTAPYHCLSPNPGCLQAEISGSGPIQVTISVYGDIWSYKSGLYTCVGAKGSPSGHSVKAIGWGEEEDGTPFWLLVNEWGTSWGENGMFKIRRGTNDCGVEVETDLGGAKGPF